MTSSEVTVLAMLLSATSVHLLAATERLLLDAQAISESGLLSERVLTVHFCDETGLKPSVVHLIEREVRHPFSRAGLELEWQPGCLDKPIRVDRPTVARVYVLREFPQALVTTPNFACGDARRILGLVLTNEGEPPGEVIYVSRSAVENIFRRASIAPSVSKRARALGRVITHELAHRFLARKAHSSSGILSWGAIRPRELTFPIQKLLFSRSEVELLRAVLEQE